MQIRYNLQIADTAIKAHQKVSRFEKEPNSGLESSEPQTAEQSRKLRKRKRFEVAPSIDSSSDDSLSSVDEVDVRPKTTLHDISEEIETTSTPVVDEDFHTDNVNDNSENLGDVSPNTTSQPPDENTGGVTCKPSSTF
jgi:hypothetical protein